MNVLVNSHTFGNLLIILLLPFSNFMLSRISELCNDITAVREQF